MDVRRPTVALASSAYMRAYEDILFHPKAIPSKVALRHALAAVSHELSTDLRPFETATPESSLIQT